MNVLLVRPKPDRETIGLQNVMICEPLELEYAGACLQARGDAVVIVDMILERKTIGCYVKKYKPDVVGITGYISHVNVIKEYAREIKLVAPQCKVIVGGVHAEVVPADFWDEHIDYILRANGLKTMIEILNFLDRNEDPSGLPGVYQPDHKSCFKETHFDYPLPDRNLTARYRKKYYYMFHNPCALMKTSFGCPYQCSFCFCRQVTDGAYFTREVEDIIAELKSIPETEIYLVDDNFLVEARQLLTFCDELEKHDIHKKFLIYGRADFIAGHEEIIARFASCGLRAVIVGLESNSEQELQKYHKQSSVTINETAIAILKKYHVECYGTLILGMDWSKADFNRLQQWLRKLDIKFINLQPFTPLPGTELYAEYQDQLIVPRQDYAKWDLAHLTVKPSQMSISRYYWNIILLYYRITMRPKNLFRMIRQYGLKENIKLTIGASKISYQYFRKMITRK
jgi:radical SAM superfamily enzyme YgiQ (UPF0313 family)